MKKQLVIRLVFLTFACVPFSVAHGFAEDLCFSTTGALMNCHPWPTSCAPGDASLKCAVASVALAREAKTLTVSADAVRSSVHVDATYLIAQYIGLDATSAHILAAYDEATDLGRYVPRDRMGNALPDLATKQVDGLVRDDLKYGGLLFHFGPPMVYGRAEAIAVDGLHPNVGDARTESILFHLRRWAYAGGLLCAGGLTSFNPDDQSYASSNACYSPGSIKTSMHAFGNFNLNLSMDTGLQSIFADAGITSDNFNAYVGESQARFARMGIYLHALQDRVSHHICLDDSFLYGPTNERKGKTFAADMSSQNCSQSNHSLRHAWETGVDFSQLPLADQTTAATLESTFDELVAFVQSTGIPTARALDSTQRAAFLRKVLAALSEYDAVKRVDALTKLALAEGLLPLPGH